MRAATHWAAVAVPQRLAIRAEDKVTGLGAGGGGAGWAGRAVRARAAGIAGWLAGAPGFTLRIASSICHGKYCTAKSLLSQSSHWLNGGLFSELLSADEECVANEGDGVDKKVRDDQRPYSAGSVEIPAVEQPHEDIAEAC